MSMVFCRGCGKEIHNTAPACPHCGASQTDTRPTSSKFSWMSIVAIIVGGLGFLASFDFNPRDKNEILGISLFCAISIVLAGISLREGKPGRNLSIVAITVSVIGLLVCLGSF
jgi:hypothetical protein